MNQSMVWDTIAAWWGAVSGTLASAVIVWNFCRDRPKIKVNVNINPILNENYIKVTASNIGKYPVYLEGVGLTLKNSLGSYQMNAQMEPHIFINPKLDPGLSKEFVFKIKQTEEDNLKEAWVCDAVGRVWRCKL